MIVAVLVLDRLDAELERLILPLDLEGERLPLLLGQQGLDALNGVDLLAVDVGDYIACPRAAGSVPGTQYRRRTPHRTSR